MLSIHTKQLQADGTRIGSVDALFAYAKEILGDNWIFTHSVGGLNSQLVFRDPTGSGDHGWKFVSDAENIHLISNGTATISNCPYSKPSTTLTEFTGMVWKTDSGSAGIGWVNDLGLTTTWFSLIKFNGTYLDKNLYGVAVISSDHIMIHGNVNIASCNCFTDPCVGVGVYLHPLFDPISGLMASDIFGVQSDESIMYSAGGRIIKQGATSYMSMLGTLRAASEIRAGGELFVKM